MKRIFLWGIAVSLLSIAAPGGSVLAQDDSAAPSADESGSRTLRRSNRMDFDARLVRGETAGTGAVVLFSRGNRRLPNLLERRRGFLRPTVEEVMGSQGRAGAVATTEPAAADQETTREQNARPNRRARTNRGESAERPARRAPARRASERNQNNENSGRRGGRTRGRR